ncbi:hypothetical protein, partial [Streptomyces hydrogenans]|uniref:hypothetical protein n=1 Tax=Streptomyces hydrogenans TaxID=1873719 RepID=UPI00331989AD
MSAPTTERPAPPPAGAPMDRARGELRGALADRLGADVPATRPSPLREDDRDDPYRTTRHGVIMSTPVTLDR